MDSIDIISAEQIVSGIEQGGLIESIVIADSNSTPRRAPIFVNSRTVPELLRQRLEVAFSQSRVTYGSQHMLLLSDAFVVGQGSVVAVSGSGQHRLIRDSAREFLAHDLTPDGFERDQLGRFAIKQPVQQKIESRCLLLKRPWSNNFGHWLVDQAMALSYLSHIGALKTNNLVVSKVNSPKLRDIMMETISAILPSAVVYEHPDSELWQFSKLDYIMPLHVPPLFKLPTALDCLKRDMLSGSVPDTRMPRRLHIVRQGTVRRLLNEPDIIKLSGIYGFEPVSPEILSMAEQATLFHNAEVILAVKGAAVTNIIFSKPSCKVMLMSPSSFTDPFFWDIASTRGIAYAETFGDITTDREALGQNDFEISPSDVESMIRATLAA